MPDGLLDVFRPDAVLIALHLESTFPSITNAEEWISNFHALLSAYRKRSSAAVFVLNFIPPVNSMDGLLSPSIFDRVGELNRSLARMASTLPLVFVVDAAQLACRSGLADWRDPRLWYLARVGINPRKFPPLAKQIARSFTALQRPAAKCLVLDLDNTVWGGILGDAGAAGIQCAGNDYPGSAYADFQRALLALRSRGVLLAIASKNDKAAVREAFDQQADMPLRPEHITHWEVHWEPKPESLKRIAAHLNIGLDSLVFLDDNPAEIHLVRMSLPQVRAYQTPARPEAFVEFLANLEDFDQLHLSAEDLRRAELYEVRQKQSEMAAAATDLESFYRSLQTVVVPEPATPGNFDRIVQLFHKTNQFNLTTRRYQRHELDTAIRTGAELWAFRARDIHGDHGIIAAALLRFDVETCELDSFLMSCRVFGRTIETAILHFVEQRVLASGRNKLIAQYLATTKNGPCRDFLARHGFVQPAENGDGSKWGKPLETSAIDCPAWITLEGEVATACSRS